MPKLLFARPPQDEQEERQLHRLARSRHAPGDWIKRARMIVASWEGRRTTAIAAELGRHPQTVRERIARFNAEGVDGLGDLPGGGRRPRLTETERSQIVALVAMTPPGKLTRTGEALEAREEKAPSEWTLNALAGAARELGIAVGRSQVRRILLADGVRWRGVRSWAQSPDPEFAPKGRRWSPSTRTRWTARRSSASMNSGR